MQNILTYSFPRRILIRDYYKYNPTGHNKTVFLWVNSLLPIGEIFYCSSNVPVLLYFLSFVLF